MTDIAQVDQHLQLEMQPLTLNDMEADKFLDEESVSDDSKGAKALIAPLEIQEEGGKDIDRPWNLQDWLYPPHLPRECQLLRKENIAIPCCYLLVGLLQGLSGPLINVYPLDLGATEAQQVTISAVRSLPASFKLAFGFLSDNVPLLGYRRKSYMMLGWLGACCSMLVLLLRTNLTLLQDEDGNTVVPDDAPSVALFSLQILLFGTGFWMADVMGDSVVAEKAKLEPPHARGSVQSSCYSYRFFGLMVAAPCSTALYATVGPYWVILLLAALPLSILPLIGWLAEARNAPVASTKDQCREIWNTVSSRSVWQPMGFVFLYNVLQVGNGAWREYLKTVLHFTSSQLNTLYIVSVVLLYLGVITYKYYLMHYSWRFIYIVTTALNGIFSIFQVLLILGITFGLSPFLFTLGDDAFAEFVQGIQFLPTTIMMVHLCPAGSEGASYAMFTTVNNSAINLSAALSTHLLGIWDVSKQALQNGDMRGMINLTLLTTAIQVGAIVFVGWLPRTKEELVALNHESPGTSRWLEDILGIRIPVSTIGGVLFLGITFASILYSVSVGVLTIVAPGVLGES